MKNNIIKTILTKCTIVFLLLACHAIAPFTALAQTNLRDIANRDDATGWLYFKQGVRMTPESFFTTYKDELGLTNADNFKLTNSTTDEIGMNHSVFQQYHKGIRVEGAIMILHKRDNELSIAQGQPVIDIKLESRPSVSNDLAIQKSIKEVGARVYAWNSDNSLYPRPELLYVAINRAIPISAENIALAYRITIHASDPFDQTDMYVNALTGQVLYKESLIMECVPGTGITNYYGTQNINVQPFGAAYELYDNCLGIVGAAVRTLTYFGNKVTNPTTTFGASTSNQNSAHWCARNTYDYFLNAHNRNSYNGLGAVMETHVGSVGSSAYWLYSSTGQGYAILQDGNGGVTSTSLATLDIVGHEFSHGVVRDNGLGGLGTNYEHGSLNESFSDIFGTMVEFSATGSYGNYFVGDKCTPLSQGGMIRNMKNPKSKLHPDTYKGTYWVYPIPYIDRGGIHTNCDIQNHWFYLLSEGSGNGNSDEVNDNGDQFKVCAIGRTKAAAIAYRNLTTYLPYASNFLAARAGSIQAAIDLYGVNSNEACQVANAWYAVGVGTGKCITPCMNEGCECGIFSNMTFRPSKGAPNISIRCGDVLTVGCNPQFDPIFTGNFMCNGTNCPTITPVQWTLHEISTNNLVASGNLTSPNFSLALLASYFNTAGMYELSFIGQCGNKSCKPCKFKINALGCLCKCGTFSGMTFRPSRGAPNAPVNCGDVLTIGCNPQFDPIISGNFMCVGVNCPTNTPVQWTLYDLSTNNLIASGNAGNPNFNITLLASYFNTAGMYELTLIGQCGNQSCKPCKFKIKALGCPTPCPCDAKFLTNVLAGFNYTYDYSLGTCQWFFNPKQLTNCDKVDWTIQGVNVNFSASGSTSSNQTFPVIFTNGTIGTYHICMRVYRPNTICDFTYCQDVIINCLITPLLSLENNKTQTSHLENDKFYKSTIIDSNFMKNATSFEKVDYPFEMTKNAVGLQENIHIFPNPTPGTFTVELPRPATPNMIFRITDPTGRLMLEKHTDVGNLIQNVEASILPNGLYFLKVITEGRVIAVEKFVK